MRRSSESRSIFRPRRAGITALVALGAMVFAGAAWSHPYTASISPSAAGTGNSDGYAYTVVDKYSGYEKATRLEITVPSGWGTPASLTVSASGGTWNTPTVSAGKIVVTAASGGLSYNQSLTVRFQGTATCTPGTSSWTPRLSGASSVFSRSNAVPTVAVTKPGRLASFAWTGQPGGTQTAGIQFSAQVTAQDACGNTLTNYSPSGASVTTSATNAPNGKSPDVAVTWNAGVGAVAATTYRAETGRTLTVADGSVTKVSGQFDVVPGQLGRFAVAPVASQTAGVQFTVSATAYDKWENLKTNYTGGASLVGGSGNGDSPSTAPDGISAPQYNAFTLPWSNGASSATATLYAKEKARTVSVSDGSVSNASNGFDVRAGTFSVSFTTQPGNAVVNATIPSTTSGQPITVAARDTWGNTPDDLSTIGLATSPQTVLSGTNSGTTVGGVAKFANLSIAAPGTYLLNATLNGDGQTIGPVSSNSFVISLPGVSCTAPCTAPSLTETSTGLTSTIAASGSGGTLSVNFLSSSGFCGGFAPIGSITNFEVFGGSTPSFDITWSVKFSNTLNPGLITKTLSSFNICLGTINTQTHAGPGFKVKGGGTATLQPDNFYWGLIPNCDDDHPANNPCIYARSKASTTVNGVTNGTVTVKFKVPYPWDGKYGGG